MDRNKTSIIVLFLLAGFFFIAIAMVFNTSVRRNAVLKREEAVEEKIKYLNSKDLTIYWIGTVPEELESLKEKINIIKPGEVRNDNMPVRTSSFRISVKEEDGSKKEIVPRDYSEYMILVINTGDGITDDGKEVIRNCIADNDIPVICIGGEACNMVGTLLIHGAGYSSDYSIFYKLSDGYEEPFLDAAAVTSGGMDLAEELTGKISSYIDTEAAKKYSEASSRMSAAVSSVIDAATATTEPSESSDISASETQDNTTESQ